MSQPSSHLKSSTRRIRHKLPTPIKIVLSFGLPVVVIGTLSAIFQTQQYDVAAIGFFFIGGLALLIYTNHSGYRIAWDDERVYMRDWGFRNLLFQRHPWHSMSYDEMQRMKGSSPPNPAPGVTRLMPYQVLEISSRDPDVEDVALYASGLNQDDMGTLLAHLSERRPDIFPEVVTKRLRNHGFLPST